MIKQPWVRSPVQKNKKKGKGKRTLKAIHRSSGPPPWFQQTRQPFAKALEQDCFKEPCPGGWGHHSRGPEGEMIKPKKIILKPNIQLNLPCSVWDLLESSHPFLLSCFSFSEWDCLSYVFLTVAFWKHRTCLASQVHSWREIWPQAESYRKSHTFLI